MADLLCTLTLALAQPCLHLVGNFVVFKERLRPRELHRFTLDEDEVNPLSGVIKQFGPTRDLLVIQNQRSKSAIKELSASRESTIFLQAAKYASPDSCRISAASGLSGSMKTITSILTGARANDAARPKVD